MMIFLAMPFVTTVSGHHRPKARGDESTRRLTVASADSDLCVLVNSFVSENYLDSLIQDLVAPERSTSGTESEVAERVGEWCMRHASENQDDESRRRIEDQWENYHVRRLNDTTEPDLAAERGSQEYLDAMVEIANARRRKSDDSDTSSSEGGQLPSFMFQQCAGYAYATARLIHTRGASRAHGAASFILNNRGSEGDRIEGCGAMINAVNAAARGGEIQDVTVISDETEEAEKVEHVVLTDPILGRALGLPTIMATIAGITQTVYLLMEVCNSYEALIAII